MKIYRLFRLTVYRNLLISAVFLLLFFFNAILCKNNQQTMESYYLLTFGGVYLSQSINAIELIQFLVPNLFVIFMYSNLFRSECTIHYVYVFTRTAKKQKWLFQKTLQLFFLTAFIFLWLFVLAYLIGTIFALPHIPFFDFISLVLPMYFINMLTLFEFIFLQNILSMKNGSTISFLWILILYIVPVLVVLLLKQNLKSGILLYFILPANQMYLWHADSMMISESETAVSGSIEGFLLFNSLLALTVFIVISYRFYRRLFLKKDMIELIKESE